MKSGKAAAKSATTASGQIAADKAAHNAKKRRTYMIVTALAAILVIAVAVTLRTISEKKNYNDYMAVAENSYAANDYDSALSALRKAASIDETDDCLLLMVDCYEIQGNYERALEILRKMDLQNPAIASRISTIESYRQNLSESGKVTIAGKKFSSTTTSLVLDDMGLTSGVFTEIVQLYSIDSLSISGNSIGDISDISQLGGLVTLNLSNNQVSDITPLTALNNLRTLYLDNNPVANITALSSMTSLTSLSIKGINITESQLATLSKALPNCAIHSEMAQEESQEISFGGKTFSSDITELDLSNMGLRDISAISNCQNLSSINLSGNEISDLSPLMNLPRLGWLDISYNYVSDLRPLMGIKGLRYLNAVGNNINTTTPLTMMSGLTELYLDTNPIKNFSGLRKLRSATALGLSATGLNDDGLQYLYDLPLLRNLNIEENPDLTGEAVDMLKQSIPSCAISHSDLTFLVDIGGNSVVSDATELSLFGQGIMDISGIAKMENLVIVDLAMNNISNIYDLEYSPSRSTIKILDLSNNYISDITALSSLQAVEELYLTNNPITSELPLMSLSSLRTLHIGGTNLTDDQINNLKNTLIYCDITLN